MNKVIGQHLTLHLARVFAVKRGHHLRNELFLSTVANISFFVSTKVSNHAYRHRNHS